MRGLFLRTERPRKHTTSEDLWGGSLKSDKLQIGTSIEEEGGVETEIAKRVGPAWRNWKRCNGVLCDKRMPLKLKGKVYRTGAGFTKPSRLTKAGLSD